MESITMTTATQITRVRSVCPQADAIRLAATRVWAQGTAVSTFVPDAPGAVAVQAVPAFYVDGFGAATTAPKTIAFNSMDVVYLRSGEPPV
jgi:hypothetical protein